MNAAVKTHRATIFEETARILAREAFDGAQYLLRLAAPECAAAARAGSFVHLQCHPLRPLRRPISILRTDPKAGWIEILFKAVGEGTRLLAAREIGANLQLLGPIGTPFRFSAERPRPLLIGGGIGMPPMIFIAQTLKDDPSYQPFAILGSEVPFPFRSKPAQHLLPGMPDGVIGAMPLLEDWGIPSRLTSTQGYPGCFEGYVTQLAEHWLNALSAEETNQVAVYACGPHPMLEAVAKLARRFDLPCQVSLEEFMACGVGGCAGCVVPVETAQGPAMKRVCVDGPVFDARAVF